MSIHRKLFLGIYNHAGKIRDYNITKREWVLNGATVVYGSASELRATLAYDFSQEQEFSYKGLSIEETIHHLAVFIARLWQIHVFSEGNTRTTAVFFIKYVRTLGFDVENDSFAENAWYFRNALVRANYNDLKNGVHETTEYLELFLRNVLLDEKNELHNRTMHINGLLSNLLKQDIEVLKQDIGEQKQDIDVRKLFGEEMERASFSVRTVRNIGKLYLIFGNRVVFGRTDIMRALGITASPASALTKKLLDAAILVPVKGKGKGKYLFVK